MANGDCQALPTTNTNWDFCPRKIPAYLYAILIRLTLVTHIAQAMISRKGYSWVMAMGAAWETGSYIFGIPAIDQPTNVGFYSPWSILIPLTPLWINAYVYMILGRMVYNFISSARVLHVKAWRFGLIFVLLDIWLVTLSALAISFRTTDSYTAHSSSKRLALPWNPAIISPERRSSGASTSTWAESLCSNSLSSSSFSSRIASRKKCSATYQISNNHACSIYSTPSTLFLISIRIIFCLAEYSQSDTSGPSRQEAYQHVFDSTMMLFALVVFNVVHPGHVMPGKKNVRRRAEAG